MSILENVYDECWLTSYPRSSWDKVACRQLKAPWIPYIPPPPKNPSSILVVAQGDPYDTLTDPFPQFQFTSSKPYQRRPQPLKEVKDSRETFKKAGSFLENLFKKSPTSKAPLSPKVLRPALRPLMLPGMLVDRSGSHSPVSIVKEKTSPLASSGIFSGSTYSQDIASPVLRVVPLSHVVVVSPSPAHGYGNPGHASTVYPDATVGPAGPHPTRGSSSCAGSRPPAVSRPSTSSPSPMPTRSRSDFTPSVTRSGTGSTVAPVTPRSRSRSRSGSRAPIPVSRGSSVSSPPIPLPHYSPPVGSHPPRNTNTIDLVEYPGAPPGLHTRPKASESAHQVAKHNGRQNQTPRNRNAGPRAASNAPPPNRLGRAMHSNILLNGTRQKSRPTPTVPRTPGKPSRPQGQQNIHSNVGRSRSASPPSVSSAMNRQYSAFSPSAASTPKSTQGQPYLVKFDLIPDDMLIGRRHPAFSPSVSSAPQSAVQAGLITPPLVSNDTTIGRRRPSVPLVPGGSFPHGPQPLNQALGRSRSVIPAIVSDKNRIENQRNFSPPSVSHAPGHLHETQNVPRTRARSNTFAPTVPSALRNGGSPPPVFAPPPVPALPERFLCTDGPRNVDCSPPALVATVFCENMPLSVPSSSILSGHVPEISQDAPTTLVSRFKSWISRLFSRGCSELAIRQGLDPTN